MRASVRDSLWFRIGFVALLGTLAASFRPFSLSHPVSAACGTVIGGVTVMVEWLARRVSAARLIAGALGVLIGTGLGWLVVLALPALSPTWLFFRAIVPLIGAYLGGAAAQSHAQSLLSRGLRVSSSARGEAIEKLLDTSVLIDGRVPDVLKAGFIEGPLIVPQFVLHELQLVADSSDSARRNRGRRGLDVVQRLQESPGIEVDNQDFPVVREVDLKLIELAKLRSAAIVTNDFNLNKLAHVQGVRVLNINELANALKPVVLPGELMRVFILKEGKEHNQGVAYLDDGTMVVVDNARRQISKTVDIIVTSVLQTPAGKMIFGKFDERVQQGGEARPATGSFSAGASGS